MPDRLWLGLDAIYGGDCGRVSEGAVGRLILDDRTAPISDDDFQDAITRMVALCQGLESNSHSCPCGRYYRLGMSEELKAVLVTIRKAVYQRTGDEIMADSRWNWIEVD
jgi:hypothetical protein